MPPPGGAVGRGDKGWRGRCGTWACYFPGISSPGCGDRAAPSPSATAQTGAGPGVASKRGRGAVRALARRRRRPVPALLLPPAAHCHRAAPRDQEGEPRGVAAQGRPFLLSGLLGAAALLSPGSLSAAACLPLGSLCACGLASPQACSPAAAFCLQARSPPQPSLSQARSPAAAFSRSPRPRGCSRRALLRFSSGVAAGAGR